MLVQEWFLRLDSADPPAASSASRAGARAPLSKPRATPRAVLGAPGSDRAVPAAPGHCQAPGPAWQQKRKWNKLLLNETRRLIMAFQDCFSTSLLLRFA